MQGYQIILLLVCLVIFFYIALLIFVVTNAFTFRRRLKKKAQGIAIIFAQKQEILLSQFDKLSSLGVKLTPSDKSIIDEIRGFSFAKLDQKVAKWQSNSLKQAQSHLIYLLSINRWAKKDKEFDEANEILEDLDNAFRLASSLYNADIDAYNYWLGIPFCTWACYLLGCRKLLAF